MESWVLSDKGIVMIVQSSIGRHLPIAVVTSIVAILTMVRPAECGLIVLDVNGSSVDVGGDGSTDFGFLINAGGTDGDAFETTDASAQFLNDTFDAWREADNVTSGPTPSTPSGSPSYSTLNTTIVNTGGTLLLNGFQAGDDNFVGVLFVDANINSGATTYGFVQVHVDALAGDAHQIVRVIYEDMGNAVTTQDVRDALGDDGSGTNVPEPSTFALLGLGLLGMARFRRRK